MITPNTRLHLARIVALGLTLIALFPGVAGVFVGPGAGFTVLGALLAFLAAVFMAVIGFVWYPAKRPLRLVRCRSVRPSMPVTK
jgi:hypothetical protein